MAHVQGRKLNVRSVQGVCGRAAAGARVETAPPTPGSTCLSRGISRGWSGTPRRGRAVPAWLLGPGRCARPLGAWGASALLGPVWPTMKRRCCPSPTGQQPSSDRSVGRRARWRGVRCCGGERVVPLDERAPPCAGLVRVAPPRAASRAGKCPPHPKVRW